MSSRGKTPRRRPVRRPPAGLHAEAFEPRVLFAVFTVTTVADSGPGSLRQAILDANGAAGADEIRFDLAGAGVHTIAPLSRLPDLTDAVTIDATTQPGYSGSPLVELDGSAAGADADGIRLARPRQIIRGLVINRFTRHGVSVISSTGNIESSYIGVDPAGTSARPNGGAGIFVSGSSVVIGGTSARQGNVISGNAGAGVHIGQADPTRPGTSTVDIVGNFIGTDASGAVAIGNGQEGVLDDQIAAFISSTRVGYAVPPVGNVISGNGGSGIRFVEASGDVVANFIGTDASGTRPLANGQSATATFRDGITATLRYNFGHYDIGDVFPGSRNVISANPGAGIRLAGVGQTPASLYSHIIANFLGTDVTGNNDLGNGGDGINLRNIQAQIFGNLISGNSGDGIHIADARTGGSSAIEINRIGTNAAADGRLGNDGDGIDVSNANPAVGYPLESALPPPIDDPTRGGPNIISANGGHGIRLFQEQGLGAGFSVVRSNLIGIDRTGTVALGNRGSGVYITGPGFRIGGIVANQHGPGSLSAGNVISGNGGDGITVVNDSGSTRTSGTISSNHIGTNASGDAPLGNAGHGVSLVESSSVAVAGYEPADRVFTNTIAYNGGDGVRVTGAASRANRIAANRIFTNARMGIDLGGNGVTANDPMDADSGSNDLQNFPVITAAATARSRLPGTVVQFSLHATPNTRHDVEFYASATRDPSGYGEGQNFLGYATVTTDAAGDASARVTVARAQPGWWVTATSTTTSGTIDNTSEFSAAVRVAERAVVGRRTVYEDVPIPASGPSAAALPQLSTVASLLNPSAPAGASRRRAFDLI